MRATPSSAAPTTYHLPIRGDKTIGLWMDSSDPMACAAGGDARLGLFFHTRVGTDIERRLAISWSSPSG
jgi:hypothetical protein